jgi:hypothetical protein
MATKGLHLIYLYADSANEWNCSQWRALSPSDTINAEHAAGHTSMTAKLYYMPSALNWRHPEVTRQIGKGDILIFQRNVLTRDVWEAMDYWRALGRVVIVDVDDGYGMLPPSNPAYPYWILNKVGIDPEPIAALTEGMRHADALTSPSKVIIDDWAHVVRGYWLPNWTRRAWFDGLDQRPSGANLPDLELYYDESATPPKLMTRPRPNTEGAIVIGWGGSISHVDSWLFSGIVEALDRIFEKHKNAYLKFCGHEQRLDFVLNRWGDRVIRQGGVRPDHWPLVISTFDIGLAPIETIPIDPPWREGAPVASYDERRSWLKAVEYATAGVPWIASKSLTYSDLAHMGRITDNTPDAWYQSIDDMITNLAGRKRTAWERRRWAMKKLTLEGNIGRYQGILERIIAESQTRKGAKLPGVIYVERKPEPEAVTA